MRGKHGRKDCNLEIQLDLWKRSLNHITCSLKHRMTDTLAGEGKLLWRSPGPSLYSQEGQQEQGRQECVQLGFNISKYRDSTDSLDNLSGCDLPPLKEDFTYVCLILCPLPEKSLSSLLPIRDYDPSEHSLFQTDKSQFFQLLLLCQMLQSLSPFIGLTPVCWHLLHTGEPSTGPSTSDFPCQSREKGSLPLICYQHFYQCSPGYIQPSWLQRQTADWCPNLCPPGHPGQSFPNCFPDGACTGLFLPMVRMWSLLLLMSKTFNPFLHPFEVLLNNRTSIWCISHSFKLCIFGKITEGLLYPIIWIINYIVEQYWHWYNYPRESCVMS